MQTAILTLHVIVCLVLIVLVLLQAGREGMGVIFGGGGNSSVFGSGGAGGILVKLTTFLAVLFIVTSLGYNILTSTSSQKESTILDVQFEETVVPTAPAAPVSSTETPATSETPLATEAPAPVAETPAAEVSSGTPTEAPKPAETPAP